MNKNTISLLSFLLVVFLFPAQGQLRLPKLISDGMVLQRGTGVNIWGWAGPGKPVQVHFLEATYKTTAGTDGEWKLTLPELKAGGPHSMQIISTDTIVLQNILIGEVWVASGQSQMDMDMNRVRPLYEKEISQAGNENIRYFAVPAAYDFNSPNDDLPSGKWESIRQDNISGISAIAYFFADELWNKYQVPVGIVRSSLGGSPAEAWMSEEALKAFPEHLQEAHKFRDEELISRIEASDRQRSAEWYNTLNRLDKGYSAPEVTWHLPSPDATGWQEIHVPGYWADGPLGHINGSVWFRKNFDLPADAEGKSAHLILGRIVDADSVFVNGVFTGTTGYQYPPRRYQVPEGVLREGRNTIVVRVVSNSGRGGFVPDKPYELIVANKTIDLKGKWQCRLGAKMEPLPSQTFVRWKPTGLFNGMISPISRYTIKGVVWYQGESNTDNPGEYAKLFPALIKNWREKWNQGNFPFLFVQLHNFMESYDHPTESDWSLTREAQTRALQLPNTAMAVAIDLGEWNDIHPLNKKDVATRLALAAQKVAYGHSDLVASGPAFKSMEIRVDSVIISFTDTGSGLVIKNGGRLKHFAVAAADRKFVWADAEISGNKVIVKAEGVKEPVAVRYAWADNPEGANLYNREGLPAVPFRTDNW